MFCVVGGKMSKVSNKGFFTVRNGHLLLNRCGSANGQIQKHFYKPCDIAGNVMKDLKDIEDWKNSIRRPPLRKGIFTFPAPFNDAFYYHHFYEKHLPKNLTINNNPYLNKSVPYGVYRDGTERSYLEQEINDIRSNLFEQRSQAFKKIYNNHKLKKIWYKGPLYSHIAPKNMVDDMRNWWKYDTVAEWVESARKYVWSYYSFPAGSKNIFCGKINVDPGHFELFIPAK